MLRAREITKINQNKSYYKGRNEINQNGVVYTQNSKSRDFAAGGKFCYIAKISLYSEISSCSEFQVVANFYCWHCSIAPYCYTTPFFLAFIFFIPGLLKLIENHMKLMEINQTLL